MATGFIWHERYAWHDTRAWTSGWLEPIEHPENGETKRRLRNLVEVSGLLDRLVALAPRPATREEVLRVHTSRHLDGLCAQAAAGGGDAGDGETPFREGSDEIALLAAGGVIVAVDAVLDRTVSNAYALVRPPGHHAEPDRAMGFCLLNNVAIAARHAQAARGVERVAIIDWDVHHGNGTQAVFWEDPSVLFVSLHQDANYPPGSGGVEEGGAGAGAGTTLNVPLPAGAGTGAYEDALRRAVLPALARFEPELVLVSNGLDANGIDPLGRQLLHSDGYRLLTQLVLETAGELCDGRVVAAHEGGYHPASSPFCGLAVIEALTGTRTPVRDPFLAQLAHLPEQHLQPHHRQSIDAAAARVSLVPVPTRAQAAPAW